MACVLAVLVLGIVIGRITVLGNGASEVYLRDNQPIAKASPSQPPRVRPALVPVAPVGGEEDVSSSPGGYVSPHVAELEANVVFFVNEARAKAGCPKLRIDSRLVASARRHSAEMAESGTFDHESPDGASPWDRMARAGYRLGGAENIAKGYQKAGDAVESWLNSPSHRRNILNCQLTVTGVGVNLDPGGPWWTQDFGYS
ncbi:CAP domain-containing protein [Herbidospora mongoliensis]|uniref:CAP domain-containing protein n=1 Tax=Herbidospora mongoliensis TaxID=688067 RepID=UPI0008332FFE|nr:CAP domain-containing protein [Herbidospora mongoliensis]